MQSTKINIQRIMVSAENSKQMMNIFKWCSQKMICNFFKKKIKYTGGDNSDWLSEAKVR